MIPGLAPGCHRSSDITAGPWVRIPPPLYYSERRPWARRPGPRSFLAWTSVLAAVSASMRLRHPPKPFPGDP
jgi:hypothetical protein